MRTSLLATLLACTALSACVETRFESPLGDNIETCDTAWKGVWLEPGDDGRRVDGERHLSGFAVDDACAFTVIEQPEGGGPLKRTRVAINFVHAHGDDYVVDGHLIGGFAVVAYPAQYGNSGIMTFITNHEGVVYQRDHGPDTVRIAQSLAQFDPGPEWTVAGDSSQLTQSE